MSEPTQDQNLHLPSLVIKNFRGIDELTIPRLGRVTLLAGKNGVGKTTVLDAIRIWAARGHRLTVAGVLHDHDEVLGTVDHDGAETTLANWDGLFFKRRVHDETPIVIGRADGSDSIRMRIAPLDKNEISVVDRRDSMVFDDDEVLVLRVEYQEMTRTLLPHGVSVSVRPISRFQGTASSGFQGTASSGEINCGSLGPDVPDNETIELNLNELALTPYEERAIEALNLVINPTAERVAMVDSGTRIGPRSGRRSIVKLRGENSPVPLRSLGDGAVRTFAVALVLANSKDGFLLIDEAENGIHHSIQAKFWSMVLQTAERNNVQVIATTHSWDCVTGFAQAANELEDVEGLLVRLERVPAGLKAITYDESRLAVVARSDIEVR